MGRLSVDLKNRIKLQNLQERYILESVLLITGNNEKPLFLL